MSASTKPSYEETIATINAVCESISVSFATEATDGRIGSAMKESEYLTTLKAALPAHFTAEIAKDRHWYDIRINDIPINLKLTTGGTDNAFNKVALIYTITGAEPAKRNMNFNEVWSHLKNTKTPKKMVRDRQTEYYYLVVDKRTGQTLFKSILDIHTYKSNPCNDMQINWTNEFNNLDYYSTDEEYQEKIIELIECVQHSISQVIKSTKVFADGCAATLFVVYPPRSVDDYEDESAGDESV
jgi:hypothetical protein